MIEDSCSEVADRQLDDLEARDPKLYEDLLKVCEFVFDHPSVARNASSAVRTADGVVYRLPVPGRRPYCVFWTADGPRVEAVFPYER